MAVSYGPKLGLIINALTGDTYDVALRALLRSLDQLQFLHVKSRIVTAPPGSPANGDAYIVGPSATGAWAGQDKSVAVWTTDNPATPGGLWEFHVPNAGWLAYSDADTGFYSYSGTAWAVLSGGGGGPALKVNGTLNLDQALLNLIAGTNITITDGGSGAITIAASGGGGGGGNPSGTLMSYGQPNPFSGGPPAYNYGNVTNWVGLNQGVALGIARTNVTVGGLPGASRMTTTASTPTSFSWWGAYSQETCNSSLLKQIQHTIALNQTTAIRVWMGVGFGASSTLETPTPACAMIAFRYDAAVDTNWQAVVGNGSVTVVDTGVPADTNFHQFKIAQDGSGGFNYSIDGTVVANIPSSASGFPASTFVMGDLIQIDADGVTGAAVTLDLVGMQMWLIY
jgi:hypothetical protein